MSLLLLSVVAVVFLSCSFNSFLVFNKRNGSGIYLFGMFFLMKVSFAVVMCLKNRQMLYCLSIPMRKCIWYVVSNESLSRCCCVFKKQINAALFVHTFAKAQ